MDSVLIVDDEPMIRRGLEQLIRRSGHPISMIRTARNGAEALELMTEECPDFLFTDIRMPKMDGLELSRVVSERFPGIQISVVSGYGEFEYARQCVAYGVKEYVLKPINQRNVNEALEKLAAGKRKDTDLPFSPSRMEELVDLTESAIWKLDMGKLEQALDEWRTVYMQWTQVRGNKYKWLRECYGILVKRLKVLDVTPEADDLFIRAEAGAEAAFDQFEQQIRVIMDDLARLRNGSFMNPVTKAKLMLEDHLARDVSLDEIAEKVGLNASYLSSLFKQETGETFVQYRIRKRMEKARQLLAIPHYRITEISYEVGYADHPHFTKTFKKFTGQTPSEYREMLGIK